VTLAIGPLVITASVRDSVLQAGPAQPPPSNFEYPISNNRTFHPSHFWRKLSNGESFQRSWLIYSQSKNAVFCFCYKLFNVTCLSSLDSTGYSTWKNLARCLHDHEVTQSHLQAMHTYHEAKQRLETSTLVDHFLENATNKHIEYWKKILHRLLAMIQFLAERRMAFRGSANHEAIGDPKNGNFLGMAELLAKFDPVMAEHLYKVSSNMISDHYLSNTVQNELIELMDHKIVSEMLSTYRKQSIIH